jgi:hypothetical protein
MIVDVKKPIASSYKRTGAIRSIISKFVDPMIKNDRREHRIRGAKNGFYPYMTSG